jgi:hypothetical protein
MPTASIEFVNAVAIDYGISILDIMPCEVETKPRFPEKKTIMPTCI